MFNIEICSHTDIGDIKKTNQDAIFSKEGVVNGHSVGLFVVADGCGGLAYGEEISNLIVTYFSRVWNRELKDLLTKTAVKSSDVEELLNESIKKINEGALTFSHQVESKVGSTLSLLLTIDKRFYIKNVGDSRVYLLRGRKIIQLSEDQSLVADMIRNKELTKEEAKTFKKKNVLTMCIGVFEEIKTFSRTGKIKKKDIFLLCCDGLYNHISDEKMVEIIKDKKISFENKGETLRKTIENGKANDNVSSVICKFTKAKKSKKRIIITTAVIVAVIAALVACGFVFKEQLLNFYESNVMPFIDEWITKRF